MLWAAGYGLEEKLSPGNAEFLMGHLSGLQKSTQNCSEFSEELGSAISHTPVLSRHCKPPTSSVISLNHFAPTSIFPIPTIKYQI